MSGPPNLKCQSSGFFKISSHGPTPGTGECADPKGCEVPLEGEPKFASPDDSCDVPNNDPNLGPEEKVAAGCNEVALSVAAIEVGNYADDDRASIS